ncbi:MAG: hypothetical protein WCG20_03900 [bacterium]
MKKVLLSILTQAADEFKKEVAKQAEPGKEKERSYKRIFDDILQKTVIENMAKLFEAGYESIEEMLDITLETAAEISTAIRFCAAAKKANIAKELFRGNTKDLKHYHPALTCVDEAANALQAYLAYKVEQLEDKDGKKEKLAAFIKSNMAKEKERS